MTLDNGELTHANDRSDRLTHSNFVITMTVCTNVSYDQNQFANSLSQSLNVFLITMSSPNVPQTFNLPKPI